MLPESRFEWNTFDMESHLGACAKQFARIHIFLKGIAGSDRVSMSPIWGSISCEAWMGVEAGMIDNTTALLRVSGC
jgi:hypothetical protein